MPRYKLTLEYDGTSFFGWQIQDGQPTVQGALQAAIARFCGEGVSITGAGRTDAGVHAGGQVAHVDLPGVHDPYRVMMGINAHLRDLRHTAICVLEAAVVPAEFHARFSAIRRHYIYRILNRRAPAALEMNRVWHIAVPLDARAMHKAAQALAGLHDFTSFRDSQCQAKSPVKQLDSIALFQVGEEIHCHLSARSFLHHQVRIIIGSLAEIGRGRRDEKWLADALKLRDRAKAGPTAPPQGLCLTKVEY